MSKVAKMVYCRIGFVALLSFASPSVIAGYDIEKLAEGSRDYLATVHELNRELKSGRCAKSIKETQYLKQLKLLLMSVIDKEVIPYFRPEDRDEVRSLIQYPTTFENRIARARLGIDKNALISPRTNIARCLYRHC